MIWFMAGALTSRSATVPRLVFFHCLEYVQYISSLKTCLCMLPWVLG